MERNPVEGAEWIKSQLMDECPDLFIEIEDGPMPVLRIYGAQELFQEQVKKAEDLKGQRKLEIEIELVGQVGCSKSAPVETTRNLGEPVQPYASAVEIDRRGVSLRCNNADRHAVHDWGRYQALRK